MRTTKYCIREKENLTEQEYDNLLKTSPLYKICEPRECPPDETGWGNTMVTGNDLIVQFNVEYKKLQNHYKRAKEFLSRVTSKQFYIDIVSNSTYEDVLKELRDICDVDYILSEINLIYCGLERDTRSDCPRGVDDVYHYVNSLEKQLCERECGYYMQERKRIKDKLNELRRVKHNVKKIEKLFMKL